MIKGKHGLCYNAWCPQDEVDYFAPSLARPALKKMFYELHTRWDERARQLSSCTTRTSTYSTTRAGRVTLRALCAAKPPVQYKCHANASLHGSARGVTSSFLILEQLCGKLLGASLFCGYSESSHLTTALLATPPLPGLQLCPSPFLYNMRQHVLCR